MTFRGSIPHPMQLLCTLRNHCRQWPRNTRYQADATPYLGRTFTGWIAPALPGAPILLPRRRARAADDWRKTAPIVARRPKFISRQINSVRANLVAARLGRQSQDLTV